MLWISRKTTGLLVAAGCAALLTMNASRGEDPAAAGVVRISDGGRAAPIKQVNGTAGQSCTAPQPVAPAQPACGPTQNCQNGPVIVWEGKGVEMTGNPVIDCVKTSVMMHHAEKVACLHDMKCRMNGDCDACQQGGCPKCRGRRGSHGHGGNCPNGECDANGNGGHGGHGHGCLHGGAGYGYCNGDSCLYGCNNGCSTCCREHKHNGVIYPYNPWYYDRRDARVYSAQGYGIPMAVPLAPTVHSTYNYGWGIPSSRLTPMSRVER